MLGLLGRSIETDLSNDAASLQMEDGSVAMHPILRHRAWLVDWVPAAAQPGDASEEAHVEAQGEALLPGQRNVRRGPLAGERVPPVERVHCEDEFSIALFEASGDRDV